MFSRVFFFLLGFGLMVIGCTYIIMYLNLFTFGYTIAEYFNFIFTRVECLFAPIGFILITITIFIKGGNKIDTYL